VHNDAKKTLGPQKKKGHKENSKVKEQAGHKEDSFSKVTDGTTGGENKFTGLRRKCKRKTSTWRNGLFPDEGKKRELYKAVKPG